MPRSSPANIKRQRARLPSWIRPVAARSARLNISRGTKLYKSIAPSGSRMISPASRSCAPPTPRVSPSFSFKRRISLASAQAVPAAGRKLPLAMRPSASLTLTSPRRG